MSRSLRILVVDDDIDNAQSLGELFEIEGHEPFVVHSGEEAIAAYVDHNFDLAFMDVMMPGLNGVESFLEIKKLRPSAKVFMMTGYSVEELLRQAISQGAMGVLGKPMDIRAVLAMVNDVGQDGVVVAPSFGQDYSFNLQRMISQSGCKCRLVNSTSPAFYMSEPGEVIILDLKTPLIDSVGYYTDLRKTGHLPATIIVTPRSENAEEGFESLRDLTVTGILNKPFDPMDLLARLETLAA
jgi:two-component system, NtrC family, response regulator HydG